MSENEEGTNKEPYQSHSLSPELAESLNRLSQQILQQVAQATKVTQYLQRYQVDIAKLISTIVPPALPKYIQQLGLYLERKTISIPFTECGLWLTPSMTLDLVRVVVERYEQRKKRTIPAVIDGFYRQSNWQILSNAVKTWELYEFFMPRMPIFYDALEAHINKKWTLTIPTLIPHIEGIAGEILLANRLALSKEAIILTQGQKTYPSSLFGKLRADKVTPTMDVIISSLLYYLEGTLYEYKDFKKYPRIRRLKTLNRHAIMHGYQLNYASRLNSLRCFLALDSLSMLKGNIPKLV
jgi:hypothetical protein